MSRKDTSRNYGSEATIAKNTLKTWVFGDLFSVLHVFTKITFKDMS